MIENKDSNRSLVIPKWLSVQKAISSRDLDSPRIAPFILNKKTEKDLNKDYLEFKEKPSEVLAGLLLSSAITLNKKQLATQMAKYLRSKKNLNPIMINLVNSTLGITIESETTDKYEALISKIRKILERHPKNPIYWIELARLYTIKGYINKAKQAVIVAINLAPYERFIVRATFRFFSHINDFESAYYYVRKAASVTSDPWIKATEVNAALLIGKPLGKVRKLKPHNISSDDLFHYSELYESIGIIELRSGNIKKAKDNFRTAWRDPSENVIAHGEWIIRNEIPSMADNSRLDLSKSPEALSWHKYYQLNFNEAIEHARDWILQEPYSTHPFILGSHISCTANDPSTAIQFAAEGLLANPNDLMLKNNLAFACLQANEIEKAESILKSYPKNLNDFDKILNLATSGLLYFKKGDIERGRKLYLDSYDLSYKINDARIAAKALLHLAVAEIQVNSPQARKFAEKSIDISKDLIHPDILLLRRFIINRLPKLKVE